MADPYPDSDVRFAVGTLHDGRVLVDFNGRMIDHLKLTREQALEFAEGLVDAVRQANDSGRVIVTPTSHLHRPGG